MFKRATTFLVIIALFVSASCISVSASSSSGQEDKMTEHVWYDSEGNMIEDADLIASLEKGCRQVTRGQFCCENVVKKTYYDELHLYSPPTPAWCTYDRYKMVQCQSCGAVLTHELVGQYNHVHQ